jgi:hypothetical protein
MRGSERRNLLLALKIITLQLGGKSGLTDAKSRGIVTMLNGTAKFSLSQSWQSGLGTMTRIARVFPERRRNRLSASDLFSATAPQPPTSRWRRGQIGLIAAAWNGSQRTADNQSWHTKPTPQDIFAELERTIRANRSFDPEPVDFGSIPPAADRRLQELEASSETCKAELISMGNSH